MPPLTPEVKEIPLLGGLDKQVDAKLLQESNAFTAQNIQRLITGAITRRYGFTKATLPTSATQSRKARHLVPKKDGGVFVVAAEENDTGGTDEKHFFPMDLRGDDLSVRATQDTTARWRPDLEVDGLLSMSEEEDSYIDVAVYPHATKPIALIVQRFPTTGNGEWLLYDMKARQVFHRASTGFSGCLYASTSGTTLRFLAWAWESAGTFSRIEVDLSGNEPVFSSITTLGATVSRGTPYVLDVKYESGDNVVVVANDSTNDVRISRYDFVADSVGTSTQVDTAVSGRDFSLIDSGSLTWDLVYVDDTAGDLFHLGVDSSLVIDDAKSTQIDSSATLNSELERVTTVNSLVFVEEVEGHVSYGTLDTVSSNMATVPNCRLASQPVWNSATATEDQGAFIWLVSRTENTAEAADSYQTGYFLFFVSKAFSEDMTNDGSVEYAGRILRGKAFRPADTAVRNLPHFSATSYTGTERHIKEFVTVFRRVDVISIDEFFGGDVSDPATIKVTRDRQTLLFAAMDLNDVYLQNLSAGEHRLMNSGFLSSPLDDSIIGIPISPEFYTAAAAGSGSLANGFYYYKLVHEILDRKGNLMRSEPSRQVSQESTAGGVTLTVPVHKWNHSKGRFVVYRTTGEGAGDITGAGTVFHRAHASADAVGTDSSEANITITDDDALGDDDLATKEILYTEGGVLSEISPSVMKYVAFHKNRIFGILAEDPRTIVYTKKLEDDRAPAFSDALNFRWDDAEALAMASLDDTLVLFSERGIGMAYGDGPETTGAGLNFETRPIVADVGVLDPLSVQVIPQGVIFRSPRGWQIVDRSFRVQEMPQPLETGPSANAERIVQSLVHSEDQQVWFFSDADKAYVFDYEHQTWDIYTGSPFTNVRSAILRERDKAVVTVAGDDVWVQQREDETHTDSDADFQAIYSTPWIKTAGLAGFQRVWWLHLLGEYVGGHTLTVDIYYDYDDTSAETVTFTAATTGAGGESDPFGIKIKPTRQKCQAIRVQVKDSALESGAEKAYTLTTLRVKYGRKPKTPVDTGRVV